jgi:pSer/pThr/pTyr-binding forkhead associated (FHA) protein
MAPTNRKARPAARSAKRPDQDDIMEINTGDVIPLFDEDLEVLEDDRKARQPMPVLPAVSEVVLPARGPIKRPSSVAVAPVAAAAPRRPRKEAAPQVEAMETLVTTSLAARENQVADAGFSEAFLYVEKGPGAGQLVPVLQGDLDVGRASESGLQLNHPSVSRKHAVLSRRGEQYFLVDAGSQNGTYVNWAKIRGEVEVFPGDQLSIGSAVVILRGGLYTSAMRRGAPSTTGVIEAPSPRKWILGVGVFGAAVGVGVAAVVLLSGRSTPSKVEPKPSLVAAAPKAEAKPEVVAPKAEAKPVVAEAPKAEPKPVVAAAEPKIDSEVESIKTESTREEPAARREREHAKKSKHESKAEKKVAAAEPAPASAGEAPPAVLKVYETGNIEGAIAAAEEAGASKLAAKMKQFNAAYSAGKDAMASKDGGAAVTNFNKALKLDESIDSGWGKLNGEIRSQLARLYVLAGNQAMGRGDGDTALKAFKAAQGYQPANAEARAKLRELQGGGSAKKAAPAANPRSAADAAFDS